jgi:probable F420-dependent oxidoreductase
MRYGLHIGNCAGITEPTVLRDVAQLAEELGYDSILMGDHVLPPRKINSPYPLPVANPRWETYQDEPWPDCFVTLGFLAAATRRVRLGTSVLILPYRHPAVVAKLVATLDCLSGGRIICGVGVGWVREEFGFLGVPFAERATISDEYVAVMKSLWTQAHPRIAGRYVTIDQAVNSGPFPIQQPHPPIWVGGNTRAALRRAACWGDGWQPLALSPEALHHKLDQLRALMADAGRDFDRLAITTTVGADVTRQEAEAYQAVGVSILYLLGLAKQPEPALAQIRQFAATLQGLQ